MSHLLGSNLEMLLDHNELIPILAIVMGCGTGIIAIIFSTIAGVAKAKAREATKREIAAYVAEGSIAPDAAIAMLNAGNGSVEIGDEIKIT